MQRYRSAWTIYIFATVAEAVKSAIRSGSPNKRIVFNQPQGI